MVGEGGGNEPLTSPSMLWERRNAVTVSSNSNSLQWWLGV